jgi:hypothetical protein
VKNRIYRLGQRVLDGISAEERLMRGLPKKISRVLIFHPSQVGGGWLGWLGWVGWEVLGFCIQSAASQPLSLIHPLPPCTRQVTGEQLMAQMSTMTTSYGIKAVGKAAAATVMLPLAIGIDLIILPGPQVLTYYTGAWGVGGGGWGGLGERECMQMLLVPQAITNLYSTHSPRQTAP